LLRIRQVTQGLHAEGHKECLGGDEAVGRAAAGFTGTGADQIARGSEPGDNAGSDLLDNQHAGHTSLRAIAAELQVRGMMPRRGGGWQVSTAGKLPRRLEGLGS